MLASIGISFKIAAARCPTNGSQKWGFETILGRGALQWAMDRVSLRS